MSEPVVHVKWLDSQTENGWTEECDITQKLLLTHTVGLLIRQAPDFVVIAHSKDPQTESLNGVITIPKSAIKSLRTLCRVKL